MSFLAGALGIPDADRAYVSTLGQEAVFDASMRFIEDVNAAMDASLSFFVADTVTSHKWRFYLPGGGYMQEFNFDTTARPTAVKASGSWDVALPIKDYRDAVISTDVSLAYMTGEQYARHLESVAIRYVNTIRRDVLRAIFRNTSWTFADPVWGDLTIQCLANGDGTLYPPVEGSTTEADDTHHLESGYAYTAISDTNNPLVTIRDEIREHFGTQEAGEDIVVVVNKQETAYLEDLTDWVPVTDFAVRPGDQTATLSARAMVPPSFRYVGRCNGVFVYEWDWMPAGYMVGRHMNTPAPLSKRIDSVPGLGTGNLELIAQEEKNPLESMIWRTRCGFGVTNRLNGCVMELGTGGTYTVPTAYA